MNPPLRSLLRAAVGLLGGAAALSASPGFAVLELFTSQGCSSCPSADRLLATLAHEAAGSGRPVYVLSFHVDYWDRLGWKDPYSRPESTRRQEAYSEKLSARIYPPQLIVNGREESVGSDSRRARALIESALQGPAAEPLRLSVRRSGRMLRVSLPEARKGEAVNLALVEQAVGTPVKRGENRGRTLTHVNVVREFLSGPAEAGFELRMPEGVEARALSLIAYAQAAEGTITAAGTSPIPE